MTWDTSWPIDQGRVVWTRDVNGADPRAAEVHLLDLHTCLERQLSGMPGSAGIRRFLTVPHHDQDIRLLDHDPACELGPARSDVNETADRRRIVRCIARREENGLDPIVFISEFEQLHRGSEFFDSLYPSLRRGIPGGRSTQDCAGIRAALGPRIDRAVQGLPEGQGSYDLPIPRKGSVRCNMVCPVGQQGQQSEFPLFVVQSMDLGPVSSIAQGIQQIAHCGLKRGWLVGKRGVRATMSRHADGEQRDR